MAFLKGIRISTFLFAGVQVYFAVHFFVGQQGLLSWRSYVQKADELTLEHQSLIAQRQELEARVQRFASGAVDVDFLEERAFVQLGMVGPDDIVIRLPVTSTSAAQTGAKTASSQTRNP